MEGAEDVFLSAMVLKLWEVFSGVVELFDSVKDAGVGEFLGVALEGRQQRAAGQRARDSSKLFVPMQQNAELVFFCPLSKSETALTQMLSLSSVSVGCQRSFWPASSNATLRIAFL